MIPSFAYDSAYYLRTFFTPNSNNKCELRSLKLVTTSLLGPLLWSLLVKASEFHISCCCLDFLQNANTYEQWHGISKSVECATSKASDQLAHTRSLIRAFASRLNIL